MKKIMQVADEAVTALDLQSERIILDNIVGVGVLFLKERKVIWANRTLGKMFGYSFAELEGRDTELLYPDPETYRKTGVEGYAALARGEVFSETVEMRRKDGTRIWCVLVGQAVDPDQLLEGTIWTITDVTECRQMEAALRQSEETYRTVADFTHDWEFWIGPGEEIRYISPSCERVTDHTAQEFEQDPGLLRRLVHPDDLPAYERHRHGTSDQEVCDGFEFRVVRPDGSIRWVSHVCQPVYDAKGLFAGTRGSNRDITEHKEMEYELLKARNLESISSLVGGIAHDFNNLFQGLLGNLSLAKMSTPESSEAFPFLQAAEQVYAVASNLTNQLLAFSSGGIFIPVDLKPAELIREIMAANSKDSNLLTEFELADDLWMVHVDSVQFRQVIGHLVQNASEAMPSGGRLRIRAVNEILRPVKRKAATLPPGNYVKISIQDQGNGISKENLPRIFDPYFSTKQRGAQKGMGLGLSLCDTIVKKNGGAITVETRLGRGTTVHVHIPALVAGGAGQAEATMGQEEGQGPRILIMDDESGVVQVATKFLQMSGYQVDSAINGEATITAYRSALEKGEPYAAVILDLSIPGGLGGKEAVALLKEIDPQVKAIVSSGYSNDPVMSDYPAYGFVAALAKPYGLREMKEILDRLV